MRFDHVGIVVKELAQGFEDLARALPLVAKTRAFDDHELTVSVQFAKDASGMVYELIAPLGEKSVVSEALAKKRDVLNQLAYKTADLPASLASLRRGGGFPLGEAKPALAFGGAKVQFVYVPLGFIVELIEDNGHGHHFTPLQT